MTQEAQAPLVPAEVDLRGYEFMPLYGDRLFKSETWIAANPEAKVAALKLWWQSYAHEFPAGSLPDNDTLLAEYSGYGVAVKAFLKLKPHAMRGWVKCSDGRLYHPFVADLVKEAWEHRKAQRNRTEKARQSRLLQSQSQTQKDPVTETVTSPVTASTGQDRTGQDIKTIGSKERSGRETASAVDLAVALRSLGVPDANGTNPVVLGWVEQGVTVTQVEEACRIAQQDRNKPRPSVRYLDPIVRELLSGKPTNGTSQTAKAVANLQRFKESLG